MSLPVVNLDDRKFQDLVDEAKRLIPKHCAEWTNHNLSDPGVALIELFAWLTEMAIFRLNQVPDTFYTRMLNLMGFERFPATAARADVTFWLVSALAEPITVRQGTQVSTTGAIGPTRVFTTLEDLTIRQPEMTAALTSAGFDMYTDIWEELRLDRASVTCFARDPITPGDCFYIGFADSLAGNALQLEMAANVEGIGVIPTKPPLRWEIWNGEAWAGVSVYRDTTGGLNRHGTIVMLVPDTHEPLTLGGQRAYWLRARLLAPEPGQPSYRSSPQIRTLRASSIGGTVTVEHSDIAGSEILGTATGQPDQVLAVRNTPVLPRAEGETVVVDDDDGSVEWIEVEDFCVSGPDDRHFVWDPTTGEVHFGPLIRYPDGSTRQHGSVPREGARVRVTGYRFGGGAMGNVGAGTINALRTTIPYVSAVENVHASLGGVDAETVENAKKRGPQSLRTGGRAVTAADFERLAAEADPSLARVRCLPPTVPGSPIRLLLVPKIERPGEVLELDDFALPMPMVQKVRAQLDERRILGSTIEIGTPFYQGVTIAALVAPRPGRPVALVRERALSALYRFLNPLSGGLDGTGWAFDTDLNSASVFHLLEAVEGVERVEEVLLFEYDLRNHERLGFGKELVKLGRDSLFLSANHQVVVR